MSAAAAHDVESQLADLVVACRHDPLLFVERMFPWGEPGDLELFTGPDVWQVEILTYIGEKLRAGEITVQEAIQIAVSSGHGIGKSALVSWLTWWGVCTFPDTKGVVTANTENQLRTKTWAEIAKWHRLLLCKHWFKVTATAIFSIDKDREKTWRIDMVPWSEANTEAFAGLHNKGKRVLLIFDEASAIPDTIWEVSEGALTDEDTEILWIAFGNPTRNTGRFRECFGRFKHRWFHKQIDSRHAKMTNKEQIQKWIDDWGFDSDFVRVRVRGEFPSAGSSQFIPAIPVAVARKADIEIEAFIYQPIILGVDVARFGDDQSAICVRQGRKVHKIQKYRNIDTFQFAARISEYIREWAPAATFVDVTGVGAGVVDSLRGTGYDCIEFVAAGSPEEDKVYLNKRAEVWGRMRTWLQSGADIPDDPELAAELVGVEYKFTSRQGSNELIQLESKQDMKKRGLASPDVADSLSITFTEHVVANVQGSFEPAYEDEPDY